MEELAFRWTKKLFVWIRYDLLGTNNFFFAVELGFVRTNFLFVWTNKVFNQTNWGFSVELAIHIIDIIHSLYYIIHSFTRCELF